MLASGHESVVRFRLLVDATGKITKCTSLSHFQEKQFEQLVCEKIARRARLRPAELEDGTKVPSYFVDTVRFQVDG
jgi:protein TonB